MPYCTCAITARQLRAVEFTAFNLHPTPFLSDRFVPLHLLPPEVVDQHHAGQVQHHAQTLEGGQREPQGTILVHQARRVVPAIGAALAARHALSGRVRRLVSVRALLLT